MIEDLEGATAEPTRRPHMLILSAAVASIAIVLLLGVVGVRFERAEGVAAPAATSAPATTSAAIIATNPLAQMRVDLSRTTFCADGTRLTAPMYLSLDASTQRIFVSVPDPRGGVERRAIPAAFRLEATTGWMTVTCATDDLADLREAISR